LPVIFDDQFSGRELKHSFQTSPRWIPQVEFVNYERRNRDSGCNICALLGGICAFFGNSYRSFQNVSLSRHFSYLFMHRPQLPESKIDLPPHFSNLSIYGSQTQKSSHDASDADTYQQEIWEICRHQQFVEIAWRLAGLVVFLSLVRLLIYYYDARSSRIVRICVLGRGISCVSIALGLG